MNRAEGLSLAALRRSKADAFDTAPKSKWEEMGTPPAADLKLSACTVRLTPTGLTNRWRPHLGAK